MTDDAAAKTPEFAFLRAGAASGRPWRDLLLTLLLGGLAGFVALTVAALVVFVLAAAILSAASSPHVGLLQAVGVLSDVGRGGRSLQSYVFELSIAGLSSYAGALAFLAVAARVERRPIRSFLTAAPRFRWRQVGLGLAIFLPIVGLAIGLTDVLDPHAPSPPLFTPGAALWARVAYFAAAAVCLYLAALSEEMLFRGWALQRTGAFTGSIPIVLALNGVLFSLAHFDPDVGALLSRAVMGAGWAWIVLRLAGVELAAGAHLANNLAICLFSRPVVFTPAQKQPLDLASVAVELASIAILVAVVEWALRRWPQLGRVSMA
jgi:membrane protease YdiL (CAAX protease family)